MIFNKGVKATQWRKESLFNKQCRNIGYPYNIYKTLTHNSYQTQKLTENESQIDLNVRAQTIKLLQGNIAEKFATLGQANISQIYIRRMIQKHW